MAWIGQSWYRRFGVSVCGLCIKCTVLSPVVHVSSVCIQVRMPIVYMSSVCILYTWSKGPSIVYGIFPPSAVGQTLKFCQRGARCTFRSCCCKPPLSQKNSSWPQLSLAEYVLNMPQLNVYTDHKFTASKFHILSWPSPSLTPTPLLDRWSKCFTDYIVCSLHCLNSYSFLWKMGSLKFPHWEEY